MGFLDSIIDKSTIKPFPYSDYSDACEKIGAEQSRKHANKDMCDKYKNRE